MTGNLKRLVESYHLVVTHNMDVERGFSIMKIAESTNQSNMTAKLYDSLLFVRNRFDHQQFETYDPPEALLCKIKSAGTEYKRESQMLSSSNRNKETQRDELRESLCVFKRTPDLKRKLNEIDKELEETNKRKEELEEKKRRLELEISASTSRAIHNSERIISSMF